MTEDADVVQKSDTPAVPEDERSSSLPENLNEAQKRMLEGDTPPQYIKQREARGGRKQDYVEVHYIRDQLNKIFGHDWDEEIVDKDITDSGHIVVHVRLTARIGSDQVVKDGIGGDTVTTYKNKDEPVDIGDDVKSAVADGLKKAASKLGIAQDVYWHARPSNHGKQGEIQVNSKQKGNSDRKGRGNQQGKGGGKDWSDYTDDDGSIVTSDDDGDGALWRAFNAKLSDWAEAEGEEDFREEFKKWLWEEYDIDHELGWSNLRPKQVEWVMDNLESLVHEYQT